MNFLTVLACLLPLVASLTMAAPLYLDTSAARQAGSRNAGSIIPRITKKEKADLMLEVARRKVASPLLYRSAVAAAVSQTESTKKSASSFGMSVENIEGFERSQALVSLKKGVDISEPEIANMSVEEILQEGRREVAAWEVEIDALRSGVNTRVESILADIKDEIASNTVATFD